jgi:hypothetical protein
MTTRADLVASISSALHSYTGLQEQSTHLTAAATASATSLSVNSSDGVMRGIAEIDEELVYISSTSTGTLTLAPYGRGYRGSTAAAHSISAQVTFDPAFPKVEIGRALDQVIAALYPMLYQVKTTTLDAQPVDLSYDLPAECGAVLNVEGRLASDPSDYWRPMNRWEFDATSSAPVLNLYDGIGSGYEIRVHYQAPYDTLTTTLAAAGIPESHADLLLYGVASRMIRFLGPARLQLTNVENVSRAQVVAASDAGQIANQLFAMYQSRLAEERRRLLDLQPVRHNFLAR